MNILTLQPTATPSSPADSQQIIGDIESFLKGMIERLEPETPPFRERGRPQVLPALALWSGLLVCILKGFNSQLALWRLLARGNFWYYPQFPISDQAVYKRLASEGAAPLQHLFYQIRDALIGRLEGVTTTNLASFAKEVVVVDETTLDQVARRLSVLRGIPAGDSRLLPGKLAGLFDVRRQRWLVVEHNADPHQNEKVAARDLVATLPTGSLILADLGYFGFAWFDWLTDNGYYWISRLRKKTSYRVAHCFYQQADTFDGVVWLGVHRADRAAHAVRLVRFRVGKTIYQYLTNALDPRLLPIREVAKLYARRWDFELAVNLIKQHLGLHLLWSAKPIVVMQQVWAVLIIAQILQALRLEIAWRAEVDPFDVSIKLLVEYLPRYAAEGNDPVEMFVKYGLQLRFIRPSQRANIRGPSIPEEQLIPLPADLELVRTPRYAGRRCNQNVA